MNLEEAGFLGIEADEYDGEAPYHLHRMIISRVPSKSHAKNCHIYILCPGQGDHSAWIDETHQFLVHSGHTVQRFAIGDSIPPKQRVISLVDLGGPFFQNINEENWQ